jgi:DNA polymerase-1
VPVGFSAKAPGMRSAKYYAWGHPTENNCSFEEGRAAFQKYWNESRGLLFHNAKFDVEVATKHMGVKLPTWDKIHDTLFMIFLHDPHQRSLSLKPSAERILGLPPDEQDAVKEWLVSQKIVRANQKDWGAYICQAPGKLVGTYANGDVLRTEQLFKKVWDILEDTEMMVPYDRERELMPILLRSEQRGLRIDEETLNSDIVLYQKAMETADGWLRKTLKKPELNVDSDREVADALEELGIVTEFRLTEKGNRSVSKKNLTPDMFNDPRVAAVLGYRNRLTTCLGTFMLPWAALAAENKGRIHTNWSQVRQAKTGNDLGGTRTGRLSCSPNLQNIPKSFEDKNDGFVHPKFLRSLPMLPLIRRYVLPEKGHVFAHRDFNGQELRILGHFEDHELMKRYQANPRMDVHDFVKGAIHEIAGIELTRSQTKIMNFGMLYGMGLGKLSEDLGVDISVGKQIKEAQLRALPGLKALDKGIKDGAKKQNLPIRTWGGRLYYAEPPIMKNGRRQTFEYKLLNYLIQGSAADCTKQAVINYDRLKKNGEFLVTVHDEINISVPERNLKSEMKLLQKSMEDVEFDVKMLSDAKVGPTWGDLKKYED